MTTPIKNYGTRQQLTMTFDDAVTRVPEALKAEGFGVITEFDVQQTLRAKLDVPFRRYKILGACNPPLAHQALEAELEIGLLLPCNVVIYEDDDRRAVVLALDPTQMMGGLGNPVLTELAGTVRDKLGRALAALA